MPTYPPNATFTPRLVLPRPGLDDVADGPDAFNDLTDVLDPITTIYAQGTLAARPPAGVAGRLYWATDAHVVYYDDGSAWHSVTGSVSVGVGLPILDVGVQGQNRAGRQLAASDFPASPIGLWNLSTLANLGTDGRALANKGAVPFGVGINGAAATCAVFAGSTSQALYIPDSGPADPLRIRTGSWGCWARTAKRGTIETLISKYKLPVASWAISADVTNVAYVTVSVDGLAGVSATGISDVCDDRWHFLTATFDGTTIRLYVDAVPEAVASLAGAIFAAPAPLNIGGYAAEAGIATTNPCYGRVDEAFVTADVLSEDQVRALYAAKLPHGLGVTPGAVRLGVHRRRRGGPVVPGDFMTQPLRLHNFTAGALTDQGSNAQALVNNGAALSVAGADGAPGGAYSFAGAQSLSATDAGLPAALTARSYGAWFKAGASGIYRTIVGWSNAADVLLQLSLTGTIGAWSGADSIVGPYVTDGQWHLAIAVDDNAAGDGVRRKLYVDGRLVGGSTVMNALTLGGANRFRIGSNPDATAPMVGQIDGAFVCGYALTQDEVLRLYAKGSQALSPSPKNAGDHVEAMQVDGIQWVADTLESQHTVDVGVVI